MTNQNPTNQVVSEAPYVAPPHEIDSHLTESGKTPIQMSQPKQELIEKIKTILINIFNKLYSNKMVFWSLTSFLGIVLLIIVTGLLFGQPKSRLLPNNLPTTPPFILATPVASVSDDVISTSQERLIKLKDQLNKLDIKQGRLDPPTLNFDIKF